MKTKNIVFTILGFGILIFTACSKFLDENPKSEITSITYYQNEAQAEENVNALYRRGAPTLYGIATSAYYGPYATVNVMLTGYFTNSYEGQELTWKYSRELDRQNHTRTVSNTMNQIWNGSYEAINIANGAIKYIPEIAMDEDLQKKLVAEARFFRAFNYFYLVKTFGAIPLSVEPYESLENLYLPRTDEEDIYTLIESDLKNAVDILPEKTFASNGHRITKYVASMVLSDVYLQQSKYTEAAEYAKNVINSPHSLTDHDDLKMNSAYNKLRENDDLPEAVYSYEYNATISNSGRWPSYAFSSSATSLFGTYSIFERVYGPTKRFLNIYRDNDLRIQPNQFFHWEYTNPKNGRTWSSDEAGVWYYFDEEAVLETGKGTKDWNIYRYAEALLNGAESLAKSENNVSDEAAGYLAQIKARADINGKTEADYKSELKSLSVDEFVEECWTERLRELPLEFKMWDDILRTQKYPSISETQKGEVDYQPLIGASNASGAKFTESDLLWPISLDELQRNNELTQNPGYPDK